jgi:hypothetical protein
MPDAISIAIGDNGIADKAQTKTLTTGIVRTGDR